MAKQTIEQIRAELDALNEKMAKKRGTSDLQIMSAVRIGKDPNAIKKRTQHHIGKPKSTESKLKISQKNKGRIPHNKGKSISDEQRLKLVGKKASNQTKEKMSQSKIGIKRPQVECPHCGKIGSDNTMPRWHFDNCKQK
jgi:hypothetical protein